MSWANFDDIGTALATLISANVSGFEAVIYEADDLDEHDANMPLCEVFLEKDDPEVRVGQDYVNYFGYAVEIYTEDLSKRSEAVSVRNGLVREVIDLIRANPRFHVDIESTLIGSVEFQVAADEEENGFVAAAKISITVVAYSD